MERVITSISFACVYNTMRATTDQSVPSAVGSAFTPDYVKVLYSALSEHTATWRTYPVHESEFVCLTDDPQAVSRALPVVHDDDLAIRIERLTHGFAGWWAKLELFRQGLFSDRSFVIYIDLDTIILQSLRPFRRLHAMRPGAFWALRNFSPTRAATRTIGSAIMCWPAYMDLSALPDSWPAQSAHAYTMGDEQYITQSLYNMGCSIAHLQHVIDGIYSYKRDIRYNGGPPDDARLVCFHGKPRPHEVLQHERWLADYWSRYGGATDHACLP